MGFDRSDKLLELCKNHNHQVIRADCRLCPVRDGVADAAICIAVIHHLATEERRLQSIKDIARNNHPAVPLASVYFILALIVVFCFLFRYFNQRWSSAYLCLG